MLHYFWTVTQELFITWTVVTLLYANARYLLGKTGKRIMTVGLMAGLFCALGRAVMHAFQSTPDVRINLITFYIGFPALILMGLSMLIFERRKAPAYGKTLICVIGAVVSADLLFYKAWKILWAPAEFDTAGNGFLSADFFLRFAGWALTLALLAVYGRFLYKAVLRLLEDEHLWNDRRGEPTGKSGLSVFGVTLFGETALLLVIYYGQILRTWRTHRPWRLSFVPEFSFERDLAMFTGNNTFLFILIAGLFALLPAIVLFFRSFHLRGRWDNSAQKRRLLADNRRNRRWAAVVAACLCVAALNLTVIYAADNRVIEPPSSEEWHLSADEKNVLIPVEQVNDYNLHAFEMKTENNISVRWIIIRKPNSAAYGVGLDACEVCGHAGYYQRGDSVVCKKCDVVMNTSTIGLKGGCNPIPLDFSVAEGNIVISVQDLLAAEKEFK